MISQNTPIKMICIADYQIHFDTNQQGKPVARQVKILTSGINKGTAKRMQGFYFPTEERRMEWVNEQVNNIIKRETANIADWEAKQAVRQNFDHGFVVGDILYDSWGYEQTNVDFYQVIGVGKKTIEIQEISGKMVETTGYDYGRTTPVVGDFDKDSTPMRKTIQFYIGSDNKPVFYVKSKFSTMSKYDGGENGVYCSWGY